MKLTDLIKVHKLQFGFTFFLILLEAGFIILFPLFIGFAIDDAIDGNYQGVFSLGILGVVSLVVGVGRRVFDSRFYAKVFEDFGTKIISKIKDNLPSLKTARLGMIREVVEFMENSLPELINNVIGLVGVIAIIATLNLNVFYGSLIITILIFLVYWISSKKTIKLNKHANDEVEKQVDVIAKNDKTVLRQHLQKVMKWNIKLSDLEAVNFSISWLLLIGFLVGSIMISINDGIVKYGTLFSLIMYVFQYIENVVNLPLFYQNWLRLREIQERLKRM